jgi:hypothetical protein
LRHQRSGGIRPRIVVIGVADLGGDGEVRRYGQALAAHFSEVGALASKQIPVAGTVFRRTIAKGVNPKGKRRESRQASTID